jgi:hypothetical protein
MRHKVAPPVNSIKGNCHVISLRADWKHGSHVSSGGNMTGAEHNIAVEGQRIGFSFFRTPLGVNATCTKYSIRTAASKAVLFLPGTDPIFNFPIDEIGSFVILITVIIFSFPPPP